MWPIIPVLLKLIAQYFRYYTDLAVAAGLGFVRQNRRVRPELDRGVTPTRGQSPAAPDLLAYLLELNHNSTDDPRRLIVKAKGNPGRMPPPMWSRDRSESGQGKTLLVCPLPCPFCG